MFNDQKELDEPISKMRGIGKRRAYLFAKLGLRTCFDLLCHFPVDYEDCSKIDMFSLGVLLFNLAFEQFPYGLEYSDKRNLPGIKNV